MLRESKQNSRRRKVVEVERERKQIKIHFVGNKFDEWRDCGVGDDQLPFTLIE